MIYVLPQFKIAPYSGLCINTTSSVGMWRGLSPFILSAAPAKRFENLWQYSKVYAGYVDGNGNPSNKWLWWRREGFYDETAHRYPMGKGAIPLYSIYPQSYDNRLTEHLGYIEARKRIYATLYAREVALTKSYAGLKGIWGELSEQGSNLILLDYDAYDHRKLGMTLQDVINEPKRKMGHAFVLMMMLTGELEECIGSPTQER